MCGDIRLIKHIIKKAVVYHFIGSLISKTFLGVLINTSDNGQQVFIRFTKKYDCLFKDMLIS